MKSVYNFGICLFIGGLLIFCLFFFSSILPLFAEEPEDLPLYSKDLGFYLDTYNGNVRAITIHYVRLSERKMMRDSDLIIRGEIIEILPAKWDTADGEAPESSPKMTYHELIIQVDKCYKGSVKGDTVTVKKRGGGVDGFALIDLDSFNYQPGDEVIMYLAKDSNATGSNPSYRIFHPRCEIIVLDGPVYYNAEKRKVNWSFTEKRLIFNRMVNPLWYF